MIDGTVAIIIALVTAAAFGGIGAMSTWRSGTSFTL